MSRLGLIFVGILTLPAGVYAQTFYHDPADGVIPPAMQHGSPAGSYTLNGFEDINLYAGSLNVAIPLLHIGGRGQAGYTMLARPVPSNFTVQVQSNFVGLNANGQPWWSYSSEVRADWTADTETSYGPGRMLAKWIGDGSNHCGDPNTLGWDVWSYTYTYLVFARPDGTETKFYAPMDVGPQFVPCAGSYSRGTSFVATDGSGAMFISNSPVVDPYYFGDFGYGGFASGTLYFKDGTAYTIQASLVTEIKDRNGNITTFSYVPQTALVSQITDSNGRIVTIAYSQTIPGNTVDTADVITYYGFEHAPRTINVLKRPLSGRIRADLPPLPPPPAYTGLFVSSLVSWAEPTVISEIQLANQRTYDFYYTDYNEVARIVLPTGATIDYEHGPGVDPSIVPGELFNSGEILQPLSQSADSDEVGSGAGPQPSRQPIIYRRLLSRKLYLGGPPSGTQTPDLTTTYSRFDQVTSVTSVPDPDSATIYKHADWGPANGDWYVEVSNTGPSLPAPVVDQHYFHTVSGPGQEIVKSSFDTFEDNTLTPVIGREFRTLTPGLRDVKRTYTTFSYPGVVWPGPAGVAPCVEQQQALDGNSNPSSRRYFQYDGFGNPTDQYESDYGQGPALMDQGAYPLPPSACPSMPTTGQFSRHTVTTYMNGGYVANTVQMVSLPNSQLVTDGQGNTVSNTVLGYDEVAPITDRGSVTGWESVGTRPRANLTSVTRKVFRLEGTDAFTTPDAVSQYRYDTVGNLVQSIDPRQNTTDYTFQAPLYAFLSQVQRPAANGIRQTIGYTFDPDLGKPSSVSDPTGLTTTARYDDSLDRLTQTILGSNLSSSLQNKTHYDYGDSPGSLSVKTQADQFAFGDALIQSESQYDSLGREVLSCTGAYCSGASVQVQTQFDILGRQTAVSNPGDSAPGALTSTTYDPLGRATAVCPPASPCATTQYQGNTALFTDPGGEQNLRINDGLGRLGEVDEAPNVSGMNYRTVYTYDARDNLIGVNQLGTAGDTPLTRGFDYDSLKRLREARNPESGTTKYSYDANGNLSTAVFSRTAPDDYTVCYGSWQAGQCTPNYDALNRLDTKTDSNGSLLAQFCFDGQTYAGQTCTGTATNAQAGRLTGSGNGTSSTNYGYDALGRITSSVQTTGQSYVFQYGYYLNGQLAGVQYPSQSEYFYCYDPPGRARWVKKVLPSTAFPISCDPSTPTVQAGESLRAQVESYAPQGGIQSMLLGIQSGIGFRERWCYNTRLQPVELHFGNNMANCNNQAVAGDLLTLQWSYTSAQQTGNNGNLQSQIITTPNLALTQTYTYDGVNRITSITEGTNQQTWQYDARGNRWVTSPPPPSGGLPLSPFMPSVSSGYNSQNQLSIQNALYADRGNQTAIGGMTFTYDGESRMQTSNLNGVTTTYFYDGEGRRVMKQSTAGTSVYVYDAKGDLAAEYGAATLAACAVCYVTVDHLGSTRALTDAQGNVLERHDYMPFGDEIFAGTGGRTTAQNYGTDPRAEVMHTLFTGKYRDTDLTGSAIQGLDYFGERYFSSGQGRYTSPDALMAKKEWLADPQRWNRYAYVRNNPNKYVDPKGEDLTIYYSFGRDLTDEEFDYLSAHIGEILAAIMRKLEAAGIRNVNLIDAASLTQRQRARLNDWERLGRDAHENLPGLNSLMPTGLGELIFANNQVAAQFRPSDIGELGGTEDESHRSAIYLGHFASTPEPGCDDVCAIANVGAHEIGHGLGFDVISPSNLFERVRELSGGARDLMRESQGQPTAPLDFNMSRDKNIKAVRRLNEVHGNPLDR